MRLGIADIEKGAKQNMELLFVILQEEDLPGLSGDLIRSRIPATRFLTEGLYLNKRNVTLMIGIEKDREEEIFSCIRKNCTERMEEREVLEYNGSFMENIIKQVKIGGAVVFIMESGKMKKF